MKQIAAQFQASFFNYQIPKQLTSIYDQDYVRSNDLRLLLEIATGTSLRMFTDPKTGKLHFICKQRGSACYDINAIPHPRGGYFFCYDYLKVTHKDNCRQYNEAYQYLIIYNLMKLKKKLIEDYMLILDAEKDSPSFILAKLSKEPGVYFFEKYINGHVELKRKLRKRFDNIVNIDIKKIGKPEDEEKKVKKAKTKKTKAVKKGVKLKNMARRLAAQRKRIKEHLIARRKAKKALRKFKIQAGFHLPTKIRRKFLEHNRKSDEDHTTTLEVKIQEDPFDDQKWKVKCQEDMVLPQIRELSERAQYIWSQSEPQSPNLNSYPNYLQINIANYQDYFKSLRNSTLKKSLERQSLTKCFFSTDSNPCKENKQ